MSKRDPSNEERLLGELLEGEAAESRPAFSESLHHRVLSTAKQRLAVAPAVAPHRRRGLAFALAAACVLCAVAIGWQVLENASWHGSGPGIPPGPQVTINDLPSINELADHTVGRLDSLTVSAALEPQKAHLKHDARAVADMFLDRLPIDPKMLADNR